MEKAVVYLLSKNYFKMAINSISMLRKFNKQIKIICLIVDDTAIPESLNIEVVRVENINEKYFLSNKSHLKNIDSKSVLYIDCDTFIFDDIEKVFEYKEDFCGCENRWSYKQKFNYFKPLNGGVLLFNNFSHKKIYEDFNLKINNFENLYPKISDWTKQIKNEWVKEEFLTSAIAYDLDLTINFFENKYVKIIEDIKDIDKIKDSIIFHSFAGNWEFIKNIINKDKIKLFKKYKKLN
jgi:hypothetical protein